MGDKENQKIEDKKLQDLLMLQKMEDENKMFEDEQRQRQLDMIRQLQEEQLRIAEAEKMLEDQEKLRIVDLENTRSNKAMKAREDMERQLENEFVKLKEKRTLAKLECQAIEQIDDGNILDIKRQIREQHERIEQMHLRDLEDMKKW